MIRKSGPLAAGALSLLALAACEDITEPALAPEVPAPVAAASLAASDAGTETPVLLHPAQQNTPDVAGSLVVYSDSRLTHNREIYAFDLASGKEILLSSNPATDQFPVIDGTLAAWERWAGVPGVGTEIEVVDVATGASVRIAHPRGSNNAPAISGHRVVYHSNRNSRSEVFLYDLRTGTEHEIAVGRPGGRIPDISGTLVTYEGPGSTGYPDVWVYDLASGVRRNLTEGPGNQTNPAVDGRRVVWEDYRHGNAEIYLFDLDTGVERRITTNASSQKNPRISGDLIVWEDARDGNAELYGFDLASGTELRLTNHRAYQIWPSVDGGRVVWVDGRSGNGDIYMLDRQ